MSFVPKRDMFCSKCNKTFHITPGAFGSHFNNCHNDPVEMFWRNVQKGEGCWPWTAAKHRDGYGRANVKHKGIKIAHRMAWEYTHGTVPAGMDVCHTCDNRICCNPAHLYLGTHAENMWDMRRKGRNPQVLFSDDQIRAIRSKLTGRRGELAEIAKEYGCSPTTIWQIKDGRSYAHVV